MFERSDQSADEAVGALASVGPVEGGLNARLSSSESRPRFAVMTERPSSEHRDKEATMMKETLAHEIRRMLHVGSAAANRDLTCLVRDSIAVCNAIDVLDALFCGSPFFTIAQLLDAVDPE